MSEVIERFKNRTSTRKFKPEHVDQEVIDQIIEAGLYAASGKNRQSAIIIQVSDEKIRKELGEKNGLWSIKPEGVDPFYNAPDVLIVLANREVPTYLYDGSLVMGNMMQAASDLGIGNCWIHRARQEFELNWGKNLLKELGIEGDYEGIGHLALGYIDGEPTPIKPRREGRVYKILK